MKNMTNLEPLQAALFLTVFIGIYVGRAKPGPDESLRVLQQMRLRPTTKQIVADN